ncbi:16S rRNA (cytosine(967)-C(5))-methyltransferase RsmB [Desulfopila sp. IMCC35006]|uniref:16S rRNA (cytosine(967)-C(5))-methyltransferase RsmB n=1 Tax=Desulfopila sp. IMCC35006 TaxID=2569542 RepID=UPI0010AD87C1|nr:16S rRNA (cytosine(967)-C(5))-methyltransferase RsmB [Desulfopila sp. IMCC35006]TKB26923.1 16S rRNA (cytosine(967)-C(5))-methyltransferase RsmB [Desulfopila sp. IMCC35006]
MPKQQSRTARYTAIETLCNLYRSQSPVKPLFDRVVQKYSLPTNERSLAMQMVYGVLRHRQFLDRILELLSRTPLRKVDPFVHQALAVGLYQLFFLHRIPESAAVNEVVESCKVAKVPQRLHGFVNGILRQAIRQKKTLAVQAQTDNSGRPILNHPDWLIQRWQQNFGSAETDRICRANNSEPTLVLRVNSARITREDFCRILDAAGITSQPGRYSPEAVSLPEFHGSITSLPGYDEGFFQVQDEAAQLATTLLGPFFPAGEYLDGCAGLGGKTSHLLQLAKLHDLRITAVEPEPQRLKKLQDNIARLFPDSRLIIHEGTLQQFSTLCAADFFHGILIDAPCSGTGVTGRHPDIRWNRRPEELMRYQLEQIHLLSLAATLVRQKGVLVYATCSLEPEENQQVVHEFLRIHPDFALTDCSPYLPESARQFIENDFFIPHPSATIDGFFAARMQRT